MTYLAAVVTLVTLALILPLFTTLLVELFAPWPKPREHHEFPCAQCPCSYAGPAELARHVTAQHTDQTAYWPVRTERSE